MVGMAERVPQDFEDLRDLEVYLLAAKKGFLTTVKGCT